MTEFINKPFKSDDWDPSKGDFISKGVIKEDRQYQKKVKRKKVYISVLALMHILLLVSFFILSKS